VRTIYATLSAVFGSVETWRTKHSDLALVGRRSDVSLDLKELERRIALPTFSRAMSNAWRAASVEEVLAHFVAQPGLARAIAEQEPRLNTDDKNLLEYSVARALGHEQDFAVDDLLKLASERGEGQPKMSGAAVVDWDRVHDAMGAGQIAEGAAPYLPEHRRASNDQVRRVRALRAWWDGNVEDVATEWNEQSMAPETMVELMVLADGYAETGKDEAGPLIEQLAQRQPIEADAIRARWLNARGNLDGAWQALARALEAYRSNPWPTNRLMARVLPLLKTLARGNDQRMKEAFELLREPFALRALEYLRIELQLELGLLADDGAACGAALEAGGEYPPWTKTFLERRLRCLLLRGEPTEAAESDLEAFYTAEGSEFSRGLSPEEPQP
jgi:hypothetical protein